jgi:hypothetical protein
MLTSILPPVGHGQPGKARRLWLRLALLHSLGTTAAAALVGGLLALLAWSNDRTGWERWPFLIGLMLVLAYLPRQLGWTKLPPLFQSTRQVPRRWAYDYPRWLTALLFGLGLGNGCYTRIVVPTAYLLFLWPFLTPGPFWPVLIWCCYGLTRSLHVWWLAWTAPPDDLFPYVNRVTVDLLRRANWMHRVNAMVLAAAAVWLATRGARG